MKKDYYLHPPAGLFKYHKVHTFDNPTELQSQELYRQYDILAEKYPNYITKSLLGEANGFPVYQYNFTPEKLTSNIEIHHPKIFMTTATHGNEKGPVYSAYNMFRHMCESWRSDPILEFLRFQVEFAYIPIVNPSGFNAHTRNNAADVNLNRNFPNGWHSGHEHGSGPASEPETQIVVAAMENNRDAELCMDYHNMHFRDGFIGYTWTCDPAVSVITNHMIQTISRQWQQEYAFFPQEEAHLFGYATRSIDGSLGYQSCLYGMQDCILEMIRQIEWQPQWREYDELTVKCGTELLVNVLMGLIRQLLKA